MTYERTVVSMTRKKRTIGKYLPAALIISFITAVFLYFTLFFETHFYPGTRINEVDVSFNTVETADRKLTNWAAAYVLVLKERGNIKEQIFGSEVGLGINPSFRSALVKDEQNQTFWLWAIISRQEHIIDTAFTFHEDLLRDRFSRLLCLDDARIIQPRSATLIYTKDGYRAVEEVKGNKVNDTRLYTRIKNNLRDGISELDLEKRNCYRNPSVSADSEKLTNTKAVADRYISSRITYVGGRGGSVAVDEERIASWILFDDNLNVNFDIAAITIFLKAVAVNYDTRGSVRSFVTSSGRTIEIGGGDYGWKVDIKKETANLINNIMRGDTVSKEPSYSQTAVLPGLNDIGSTYVEIDLTNQFLYFYVSGERIASGAVVTGDMESGFKTPEGIYSLKYKIKNAVLKGPGYRAQVSYWMPFNNDIGIHDARWRTDFGRDIYLARGSHGCINVQFYLAEKLYNNISVGTPVICYY